MYAPRGYPSRPSSQGLRYYRRASRSPPTLGGLPLDAERREALALRNRKPPDDDNKGRDRPATSAGVPRRKGWEGILEAKAEESPRGGSRPSSATPAVGQLRRVKGKPPLDTGMAGLRLRNQGRASSAGLRTAHAAGIRFPSPVVQGRKPRDTVTQATTKVAGFSDYWRFLNHRKDAIEHQVARLHHKIDNERPRPTPARPETPLPNSCCSSSSRPPMVVGSKLHRRPEGSNGFTEDRAGDVGQKSNPRGEEVSKQVEERKGDEREEAEERPMSPKGESHTLHGNTDGSKELSRHQRSITAEVPVPTELHSYIRNALNQARPSTSPAVHGGTGHTDLSPVEGRKAKRNSRRKGSVNGNANFQLGRSVGQGAYATVRLAHHTPTATNVAVKAYDKVKLLDPQKRKGVKREIKLLERMSHPNIIRFYDALDSTRQILIVTEYVGGGSLHSLLKRRPGRRLDESTAGRIFLQVAQGVKYMHDRCIIHRDLKLENILVVGHAHESFTQDGVEGFACGRGRSLSTRAGGPERCLITKSRHAPFPPQMQANGELPSPDCTYQVTGPQIKIIDFGFSTIVPPGKKIKGPTDKELYKKIARGVFQVPSHISDKAQSLMCRLLRKEADKRPPIHDVVHAAWLQHLLTDDLDDEDSSSLLCTSGGIETNASTSATGGGLGSSTTTWTPTRKRAKSEERVPIRGSGLTALNAGRPSTSHRRGELEEYHRAN
ncbi:hypothetical protein FOZ60_002027 [Perkinsus olseni]|uniref:Protein kinase domain-containing protein n=1 Tax=Perkinsus olseni TaxID=32597 RepID=A0A7J6P091_PEROL|nr:hypothetical protein FOZ60_002027 [Perkinsus olseni]